MFVDEFSEDGSGGVSKSGMSPRGSRAGGSVDRTGEDKASGTTSLSGGSVMCGDSGRGMEEGKEPSGS